MSTDLSWARATTFSWSRFLSSASVVCWGIFAGTRILNLPLMYWWDSLPPQDFVVVFADNTDRFNSLLFPLGALTGLTAALALLVCWPWGHASDERRFLLGVSLMCWAIIFLFNPLFYDQANADLATVGKLDDTEIVTTLRHWMDAQWVRTVVSVVGLVAATAALVVTARECSSAERPR
jgi:hypothetical protein